MKLRPDYYFIGADLGRDRDHSAFAVASKVTRALPEVDPVTRAQRKIHLLELNHIEQVPTGVRYTRVMNRLAFIVRHLNNATPYGYKPVSIHVSLDAAGPGSLATDLVRGLGLGINFHPIVITGGEESNLLKSGATSVPRKELLSTLRFLMETENLEISPNLQQSESLLREFAGVKASGTKAKHDDLVIAAALAAWQATRQCKELLKPQRD
ncbi:MAG: hypothetical protein ACKV2U_29510 [Bryobacteraceae bacterium]